jgi:hypothetical protein
LILFKADSDTALICDEDIKDIFSNGIMNAFFTLEQPDTVYDLSPFQKMRFSPPQLAKAPRYLETLFYTDYILKMFTTGVEISTKSPFKMRPASESLLSHLPENLRIGLSIVAEKDQMSFNGQAHRFWIESG